VVTQFHTDSNGDLSEVKRLFVQNGTVHEHPMSEIPNSDKQYNSLTEEMCKANKKATGDPDTHGKRGGLKKMGDAMKNGMVLVMSIWDDHAANMLWLDSTAPPTKTSFGGPRGSCATSSGRPKDVEREHPNSRVTFSDIKVGDFGTTYPGGKPGPTPPGPTPSGCPGGSITACIGLCPSNPPIAYKDCVESCAKRCSGDGLNEFLQ